MSAEGSTDAPLRAAPAWFRAARAVVRRLPAGRFRAFDLLRHAPVAPFADRLGPRAGRMAYHCDLRDMISREMALTGGYAPLETALVRDLLAPGGTFVDVGANLGYFTLVAASVVGAAGRVVALEPHPRLAAVLRRNVAMNELSTVRVVERAASDAAGTATLAAFAEGDGNWGVSALAEGAADGAPTFAVRCDPLDAVMDELGVDAVDLVKVDVEGAEGRVLRGMADGLSAGRYRRVLVELHPWAADFDAAWPAMAARMRGAGYRGWRVGDDAGDARRAYYGAAVRPALHPLGNGAVAGAWPHVLWALPGSEPE